MMNHVKRNFLSVVAAGLVLVLCQSALAVGTGGMGARSLTKGGDVFLGGNYIELGISATGSFGTQGKAPTKDKPESGVYFHPHSVNVSSEYIDKLGLRSNSQGWETADGVVNPDETKDFFLPGFVDEGFLIGWSMNSTDAASVQAVGSQIDSTNTGNVNISDERTVDQSTATLLKATSTGTANNAVEYTQVISFHPDDKEFRTDITLKNRTNRPIYKLTYVRRFDPEQNVKVHQYITDNAFFKGDAGTAWTVASTAHFPDGAINPQTVAEYAENTFCFYANDRRAASTYGGIGYITLPDAEHTGDSIYGTFIRGDYSIGHLTNLGTLPAGKSVTFTYYSSLDPQFSNALRNSSDTLIPVTLQPVTRTFQKGDITGSLRVQREQLIFGKEYTDLEYQWYNTTNATPTNGTAISGATGWDFEIPTDLDIGTYDYYCAVRNPDNNNTALSCMARINVIPAEQHVYTINFEPNLTGVTVTNMPVKQTLGVDQRMLELKNPQASGRTFTGWFTEKECTHLWNFSDPVSASATLYAGWASGFTPTDPTSITVRENKNAVFQTSAPAGASFQWQYFKDGQWTNASGQTKAKATIKTLRWNMTASPFAVPLRIKAQRSTPRALR